MKKQIIFLLIISNFLLCSRVYACGEITDLKTNNGKITKIDERTYNIEVDANTKNVVVSAKSKYPFVSPYGPREVSTNEDATFIINGRACGEEQVKYTIKFTKKEEKQTKEETKEESKQETKQEESTKLEEIYLKELKVEGYDLVFDKNTKEYNLTVKNDVNKLNITAIPETEDTTVTISDNVNDLKEETNNIKIALQGKDGQTKEYTIIVKKEKEKSSNNYIKSLTIENYTLNFDMNKTDYKLKINNENSLKINVEAQDKNAKIDIKGNNKLKDKSIIKINITAEDGKVRTYSILISKELDILKYWIYYVIGFVIIIIIIILIRIKISKNKAKEEKIKMEENIEEFKIDESIKETQVTNPNTNKTPQDEVIEEEFKLEENTNEVNEEFKLENSDKPKGELKIVTPTDVTTENDIDKTQTFKL